MRYSFIPILLICLLFVQYTQSLHLERDYDQQTSPAIGDIDTFLKDKFNYFVSDSGNIVWAGALTLAWHELTEKILKDDVKVNSENNVVNKLVDNFNDSPFTKQSLSQADYYIKSGYGQSTVDTINKEVKQKFPEKSTPDITARLQNTDIISFAYLFKKFQYPVEFSKSSYFQFKNQTAKGFYTSSSQQKDQIKYSYYNNSNQFLIRVQTKTLKQGVYYLKTQNKQNNVNDIIQQVIEWQKKPLNSLSHDDRFSMPVVDLDYYRNVQQLKGVTLENQGFQDYQFQTVYEALKLKIDQTGVKVQNQGGIIMTRTTMVPMEDPKQFILDDTFWIILKEQGKYPYLCIKINKPIDKQQM